MASLSVGVRTDKRCAVNPSSPLPPPTCSFALPLRFHPDKAFPFPTLLAIALLTYLDLFPISYLAGSKVFHVSLADEMWELGSGWSLCPPVQHAQARPYPGILCLLSTAEACMEPQITPSYYTTSDAVISTETVFIVEISLTCKNRVQVRKGGSARRVLGRSR